MITATLEQCEILVDNGWHNAFTDLALWRGRGWLAYRQAATHGITPPGTIQIIRRIMKGSNAWLACGEFPTMPGVDLRDPRFLTTPDALYCLVGAYHPRYGSTDLVSDAAENITQTYLTHTIDGVHWTPLTPILRPMYWGWSGCVDPTHPSLVYVAAYHTGQRSETSSIALWGGTSLYKLQPLSIIYDGSASAREAGPHFSPSEPLLFSVSPGILGCYVRSEKTLDIGLGRYPYRAEDWRWSQTAATIHPSAQILTRYGRLLVGRGFSNPPGYALAPSGAEPFAGLWHLDAQHPRILLQLPSRGDCAYAGIVAGLEPDTYLVSYYSSPMQGTGLQRPGTQIRVATVTVHP